MKPEKGVEGAWRVPVLSRHENLIGGGDRALRSAEETEKIVRRQNTHRPLQEMSDIDGDRAVEMEEEEEVMTDRWGDEQLGEDEEEGEEDEERGERGNCSIQWGGEEIVQPASKVRRRTFFDIFEDNQLDDGESLRRNITIILFLAVQDSSILLLLTHKE